MFQLVLNLLMWHFAEKKVQLGFNLIMGSDLVKNSGKANATVIYVLISTIQAGRSWVLCFLLSLPSAELIKHSAQHTLYFSCSLALRKLPCCQKSHTNKKCTWTALALFTLGKKLRFSFFFFFIKSRSHLCWMPEGLHCWVVHIWNWRCSNP